MDSKKIKKFVLNNLAYVIFAYAGNIICFAFRTAEGKDISEKILPAMTNLGTAFAHIIPSFNPIDIVIGILVGIAMKFIMKMRVANKKKMQVSLINVNCSKSMRRITDIQISDVTQMTDTAVRILTDLIFSVCLKILKTV